MSALALALLTFLAAAPAATGAESRSPSEVAGVTDVAGACCDVHPGGDAPEEPRCPEGNCCAACAPCCNRAAWSQTAPRPPDGGSSGTLPVEAESPPGADSTGAVWHPPQA